MDQLNLFEHAPRHYHEALQRLGRLEFEACRSALDAHRRRFPHGPDPWPVEQAARWLETHLPEETATPRDFGLRALETCRCLREGRQVAGVLGPQGEATRGAVRTLSKMALEKMRRDGAHPSDALAEGLPWAVFQLWAGRGAEAVGALVTFLRSREPTALGYLALGDALWATGWRQEANCAYREGYGLDPAGGSWVPSGDSIASLRRSFDGDPLFADDWWVVGAYLEDGFPAYEQADEPLVARRWQRFVRQREASRTGQVCEAALFFAGLFLSEHGFMLGPGDLALTRRTIRQLHREAYEMHLDRLEERGPPARFKGRLFVGW